MTPGDRVKHTHIQWQHPPEEGTVIAVENDKVTIQWDASEPDDELSLWYAQEHLEVIRRKTHEHDRTRRN